MTLFSLTPHDEAFYRDRLEGFLPERMIDIHTHCWLDEFRLPLDPSAPVRAVSWPALVAADDPIESLVETYELMFPGKRCGAAIFGFPDNDFDVDRSNDYVAEVADRVDYFPLLLSRPEWTAAEFAERLDAGRFLGSKVYLNFAPDYLPGGEIRIFDFAPKHQLEVLNERRGILILHIPRAARLKDPVNIRQLLELAERYPDVQTVVAHVGRAYCDSDLGDAFAELASADGLMFDISANTNAHVFSEAIANVGPQRLLFGSDLPITRMRMRRICEDGRYINIVPPGLYGDVSDDPNMRESSPEEADKLTFFLYEEIDAFRRAAEEQGLSRSDVEDVFCNNAVRAIETASAHYATKEAS